MQTLKFLLLLLLVALLVSFGSLNMGKVPLNLGFSIYSFPLSLLLLGAMVFGALLVVWSFQAIAQLRLKRRIRLLSHRVKELEAQLPVPPPVPSSPSPSSGESGSTGTESPEKPLSVESPKSEG